MYFLKVVPDHRFITYVRGAVKGSALDLLRQVLLFYIVVGDNHGRICTRCRVPAWRPLCNAHPADGPELWSLQTAQDSMASKTALQEALLFGALAT